MRYFAVLSLVLAVLFAQTASARPGVRGPVPLIHDGTSPWVSFPPTTAKALADTVYVLGGPGRWDGSFETPGGLQDWHGWTHEDLTTGSGENHWHVSTYCAEYIAGKDIGNHALYCGDETIPACDPPDTIGGVGPDFQDDAQWRHSVADTSVPVTVRLTGLMNFDLPDAGWDFLELYIQRGLQLDELESWTGITDTTVVLDFTTVVSPGEFTGEGLDEVRFIWRVWTSSDGWDDVDCINPSHGACQIDDLAVFFDDSLITFDDFEPGSPVNWTQAPPWAVGDFTSLRNDLGEIDPCSDNTTWQVNFIDDGVVVPETGGTPCYAWCYDPGGWMVNITGGLLEGQGNWFLENQVVSPPIAWPAGKDGAELAFDVYRHESLSASAAGVFYFWEVRSTDSADPADLELAPWKSRSQLYSGGPEFLRQVEPVTDLMVPDRQWVQIALGVNEAGWLWNWNGPNGTPAPYFDNVSLKVWDPVGPEISVRENFLFADAFPQIGIPNPSDLALNWCRLDASTAPNFNNPAQGDSLVAKVMPLRQGAEVTQAPVLHWVMACNPAFDSVRPSAPDPQGILRGMVAGSEAPTSYMWAFDLPDTGFFFPGDRLHYYITGSDDLDGNVLNAVWPPDTTGVLDFSPGSVWPKDASVQALPSLTQPVTGQFEQPPLLFVDSTGDPEAGAAWTDAFQNLGFTRGVEFDVLTVYRSANTIGPGALATVDDIAGYSTLLYSTGTMSYNALSGEPESDDAGLVNTWLDLGGKQALMAGDGLFQGLTSSNSGYDLSVRLGALMSSSDIASINGGIRELQVSPLSGVGILPDNLVWQVYAGCPDFRHFDALTPRTGAIVGASLDPAGTTGGSYAAVVAVDEVGLGNRTAVLPFDLEQVTGMTVQSGKAGSEFSPRGYLVNYLLFWLGADSVTPVEDLPGAGRVSVSAHPNPFNPATTIAFELPRAMDVSLDIYDVQGRLVRSLLQETPFVAGGHKQAWDGHDGDGRTTPSGVYFYRFTAGDQGRVGKLTLLK